MLIPNFLNDIQNDLYSYDAFMDEIKTKIDLLKGKDVSDTDAETLGYIELNYKRSIRGKKVARIPEELLDLTRNIDEPQFWLVITEDWCGDSAQTLPYIAAVSELNKHITLRIVHRDTHPEIMDKYLTNGKRAIPKLIAFNPAGEELFQWGPRPVEAATLFRTEKENGTPKPDIYPKLHLWYGRNRGKAVFHEFTEHLQKSTPADMLV